MYLPTKESEPRSLRQLALCGLHCIRQIFIIFASRNNTATPITSTLPLNQPKVMTKNRISYAISATITALFACLLPAACVNRNDSPDYDTVAYEPEYATGFTIMCDADSISGIMIKNPWQGADSVSMSYRVEKPAERIVAMSSTFVAMLESLGATDRVVGVSGLDFITSEALLRRGDEVADVGYDTGVDYEKIVMLNPDIVLLYGVNGPSVIEAKLKELDIPYIYIGDYLEESPLAKAEWVVAIGEIIGKREEAAALFDNIADRYNSLKDRFSSIAGKPKVMINAPYGDSWWMPSTSNYMSQLIADAGGDYIYRENTGNSSKNIDIEEAYMLMSGADIWINPGQAKSKAQVAAMTPRFTDTRPFLTDKVYNNNLKGSANGGNDFYESGVMHPDVILQDLVKVFHPDSLPGYSPVYYRQLQ